MEFRQLVNDLMVQGWRCYLIKELHPLILHRLDLLGKRRLLEFRTYEGHPFLFVKTIFVKPEKEVKNG